MCLHHSRTCERRCFPLNCTISRETPPENHANSCILSVSCLPAHVESRAHSNWRIQRSCEQQNWLSSPHQTDMQQCTMIAFVRQKFQKQRTIWTAWKTPLGNSSSARFKLEKSNSWLFFLFYTLCLLFHFLHFSLIDKMTGKIRVETPLFGLRPKGNSTSQQDDFSKLVILWERYLKTLEMNERQCRGPKRSYVRMWKRWRAIIILLFQITYSPNWRIDASDDEKQCVASTRIARHPFTWPFSPRVTIFCAACFARPLMSLLIQALMAQLVFLRNQYACELWQAYSITRQTRMRIDMFTE